MGGQPAGSAVVLRAGGGDGSGPATGDTRTRPLLMLARAGTARRRGVDDDLPALMGCWSFSGGADGGDAGEGRG
jgi:hypothetical protein